jgi:hypothetical protein
LANELLQAYRSDATWHRVFSRLLPDVFPLVYQAASSTQDVECETRVLGLARGVWRDRGVFSSAFCDVLLDRCNPRDQETTHARSPSPPAYEPEYSPVIDQPSPTPSEEHTQHDHSSTHRSRDADTLSSGDASWQPRFPCGRWLGLFCTTNLAGSSLLCVCLCLCVCSVCVRVCLTTVSYTRARTHTHTHTQQACWRYHRNSLQVAPRHHSWRRCRNKELHKFEQPCALH